MVCENERGCAKRRYSCWLGPRPLTRFSANLGFLWTDLSLPDAIRAASANGFDAVECHWPYDVPAQDIAFALREAGLPMLGINTRRGDTLAGESGLAAIPGRESEARAAIDEAIAYASRIGAANIHVMAGNTTGPDARETFLSNLRYACENAAPKSLTILIEPLNRYDAPGYFLNNTSEAVGILKDVATDNLKLMFDCYHVGRTEGDVITTLRNVFEYIGHVQFAAVPDRGAPDHGKVDYRKVFAELALLGWTRPLGAEYRPTGSTEATLGWMSTLRGVDS